MKIENFFGTGFFKFALALFVFGCAAKLFNGGVAVGHWLYTFTH